MLRHIETSNMNVEIKQLKDTQTGEVFVPLTHWDAVANKPENIAKETTSQEILNVISNIPLSQIAKEDTVKETKSLLDGRLGDVFTKFGDLNAFIASKFDWIANFIVAKKDELQQFIIDRKNELHDFIAVDILGAINRNHGELLGKTNNISQTQQVYEQNAVVRTNNTIDVVNAQGSQLGKHLDDAKWELMGKIDDLQGENQEATNTAIYNAVKSLPDLSLLYAARAEKNDDGVNTYSIVLPVTAKVTYDDNGVATIQL